MKRLVVLVALLGCKDKDKKTPDPALVDPKPGSAGSADSAGSGGSAAGAAAGSAGSAAGASGASPECVARAKSLGERLATLAKTKPGLLPTVMPDAPLPTSTAGKPIDAGGIALVITKDDKVATGGEVMPLMDGYRVVDAADKRGREAAVLDRGAKPPWPLYVWADKNAKVASLAKLFAKDPDMYKDFQVRLLVEGDKSTPEPLLEKPSVKKARESMPKTEDAAFTKRAENIMAAIVGCDTLPMAFAKASTEAGPFNEAEKRATLVQQALIDCKCNLADWDLFEYTQLEIAGAFHPNAKYVDMPKLDPKDKRKVADLVK